MVYGPILHHVNAMKDFSLSTSAIWEIVNGTAKTIPATGFPYFVDVRFVDVRDTAKAHVAALKVPSASNSRYLVAAGRYRYEQVAAIVQKRHPERKLVQGDTSPLDCYDIDGSKAKRELLQKDYINLEQCITDTVDQLYELEKKLNKA